MALFPDTQLAQPTTATVAKIAVPVLAGLAGRHYFGGFGGGLLGVALYSVFLKPSLFPTSPVVPQ